MQVLPGPLYVNLWGLRLGGAAQENAEILAIAIAVSNNSLAYDPGFLVYQHPCNRGSLTC